MSGRQPQHGRSTSQKFGSRLVIDLSHSENVISISSDELGDARLGRTYTSLSLVETIQPSRLILTLAQRSQETIPSESDRNGERTCECREGEGRDYEEE